MHPKPHSHPHQSGRDSWELLASSSSSSSDGYDEEEEEQEEDAAAASLSSPTEEAPTASQLRQPLLPWALARTPAGRGQRKRDWGWRQLTKLVFWPPPIVRWLPRYTRRQGLGDALGAVCVGVMVIPQGMSCAVLAGLPPVYGLFAAMSGPFVYTLLGTSHHLSIGPVALVSLGLPRVCEAVYPRIASLPEEEAAALRVQAATAVALVSGVLLAVLGLLRLGTLAHFIPPAVMVGFTSAAGLSIGLSQTKELLGIRNVPRYPYTWQTCYYVLTHLGDGQPASAVMGLGCILFLLWVKRAQTAWGDRFHVLRILSPLSSLFLVVVTTLIGSLLVHQGVQIAIVKDVPSGLPSPSLPVIGGRFWTIAGHSLSIVLVAFLEALAIGRKYALAEGYTLHVNKELLALGAANAVASCFVSYPISGSFSRTAVSYASGTATPLANALAACLVMVAASLAASSLYYLPRATLGAIIEVALLSLLDAASVRRECRRSRLDMTVLLLTFATTLAFDTELGLLVGLSASALCLYWMPRGGALMIRLLLRPTLRRRPSCDVLVLDLARFGAASVRVRSRLGDYLRHERAAAGAAPHTLVLLDGKIGEDKAAEASVATAVREVMAAAAEAGIPKEMVVPLELSLHVFDPIGTQENRELWCGDGTGSREEEKRQQQLGAVLLSPEQAEVARGVKERAHSLSLLCEYGEQVALRIPGERVRG